ncbi:transcription factor [Schizosaccharomyces japonicus yFS275]|uniref:Transcription factor n=1 Tax=Schizosaccharomyces japonicus (strain yFS275 / FY16936) TaxID=402676 RepID=B6JZL1_SCHJY|nr:transcription factor [Schizosaccharomyces japonicus yFS275]EEB06979.1 transcription factor [Schizosaccharomyces japonicus yFS275]
MSDAPDSVSVEEALSATSRTKTGRIRKRLAAACATCRKRKIRCSGSIPSCANCQKNKLSCLYPARRNSIQSEEQRLFMMEKTTAALAASPSSPPSSSGRRSSVSASVSSISPRESFEHETRSNTAAFSSSPEMISPTFSSSTLQSLSLSEKRISSELHPSYTAPHRLPGGPMWTEGADLLPPLDVQVRLAKVFFTYCHGQPFILFHRETFMQYLQDESMPPVLMLAVCGVAARFAEDVELSIPNRHAFIEQCIENVSKIAMNSFERLDLVYVAVFLLLSLVYIGSSKFWIHGGMAIRMVVALAPNCSKQLAYYDSAEHPMSEALSCQLAHRVFWNCFMVDRFNSLYCKTQFLDSQDIKVPLPTRETIFQEEKIAITETLDGETHHHHHSHSSHSHQNPRNNMGLVAFTVRITSIWGKIVRFLKSYKKHKPHDVPPFWHSKSEFAKLDESVYEWARMLPSRLHYSRQSLLSYHMIKQGGPFAYMHICYLQSLLYIHLYSVFRRTARLSRPPPGQFIHESLRLAVRCANGIIHIIRDCYDLSIHLTAPFLTTSSFMASLVVLFHMEDGTLLSAPSRQRLSTLSHFLSVMKAYWPNLASFYDAYYALKVYVLSHSMQPTLTMAPLNSASHLPVIPGINTIPAPALLSRRGSLTDPMTTQSPFSSPTWLPMMNGGMLTQGLISNPIALPALEQNTHSLKHQQQQAFRMNTLITPPADPTPASQLKDASPSLSSESPLQQSHSIHNAAPALEPSTMNGPAMPASMSYMKPNNSAQLPAGLTADPTLKSVEAYPFSLDENVKLSTSLCCWFLPMTETQSLNALPQLQPSEEEAAQAISLERHLLFIEGGGYFS